MQLFRNKDCCNTSIICKIEKMSIKVRIRTLDIICGAQYGFLGSCLSCIDLLACLAYHPSVLCFAKPTQRKGNLVLSKGHAAAGLYAILFELGLLTFDMRNYAKLGSVLQGHPNSSYLPHVSVSSGSLGLGIAVSLGMSIGNLIQNKNTRTYVISGDGEIQAGIFWETLLIAKRQVTKPNLTIIVDVNGRQSCGKTFSSAQIMESIQSLGWPLFPIDGNNIDEIMSAITYVCKRPGISLIWAQTKRGAGISGFNERWPMSYIPTFRQAEEWRRQLIEKMRKMR